MKDDKDVLRLEQEAERARQILQEAVAEALREKKARGHYAIFAGENGKAIRVEAEDLPVYEPISGASDTLSALSASR